MSTYILGAARTPSGSFLGSLSSVPAPKLGAVAIKGSLKRSNINADLVEHVYMGNVVQAGVGQAPARQASIFAGIPNSVPCTTINKVCGSGLEALLMGSRLINLDEADLVVSGGMENMSMAPHLINQRSGTKFGSAELRDSMQWDGLWDVYSDRPMGNCAEECASKYKITREEQDEFAKNSFLLAQAAHERGDFKNEIEPVVFSTRKGEVTVSEDEGLFRADFEKAKKLRPAFEKEGTITAANASTINDGAAALVLGSEKYKDQAEFKIHSYASFAGEPTWFTTAPVEAMKKNLAKAKLKTSDIDYFEINEAFSVVTLAAIKQLDLNPDKINIYGGGVSLGHPIGCSGARILVTLMNVLKSKNAKMGMASICIGGGEALSIIIERIK